ncbi:hypothetical protein CC86DRAFT_448640 [Ophiobolus disseminans]|uniref:RNA-binding S4 domain-containing protein n=1 Tax=Ophiobolus disseminans TaxID=1469910 RepID=A0A6A6ZKL4_9PLEO|nr:hypothetical protein CC86DRAFT_448640 [Ophiobolus disseminans]
MVRKLKFHQNKLDGLRGKTYNRLCGSLRHLAHRLSFLAPNDPYRLQLEQVLTVSAFARRRLPVVMSRLHMADTIQAAVKMIEQGHVRVGTTTIFDPSYLVSRSTEDHITWSHGSKIKTNILRCHNRLDNFDIIP